MAVLEYESGDDNNGMTLIQNGIRRITINSISWSLVVVLGSLLVFLLNEVSYGVIPLTWAMQHFDLDSQIWKRPSKKKE